MSKTRNFLTGALVGLSLSGTPTPVKAQKVEASKKDLKETLAAQGNLQGKAVDFQQIRKSGESRNIAGEHLVLNDQGVQDYFAQYGTVPYLTNGATIDGGKIVEFLQNSSSVFNEDCYYYLSNNDTVYLDTKKLGKTSIGQGTGAEEIGNGIIKITGHCVIDSEDPENPSKNVNIIVNNGANFTKEGNSEIVAQSDTFHIVKNVPEGEVLPKELVEQIFGKTVAFNDNEKFGIPENLKGINLRYKGKYKESGTGGIESDWKFLNKDALGSGTGNYWTLQELETLGENVPYKVIENQSIKVGNKKYVYNIEYNSVKPLAYDGGTAAVGIWGGRTVGNSINYKPLKILEIKELADYGTTVENYNSTHIEAPKYYSESSIVDKDSLEVGKTYQVKLEAKDGFEITKVIINGEEKALGNGMVDFVAKKENTLSIDSKELLQYATITENYDGNQVESPRYYEGETEIHKEKLEIGKTYQVRLEAKDGFKITKVIINGEEKVLENGMVDFVVKKENTLEVQSEVTSGIEDKEIKKPRISLENGELTVDTQDSTIKTVQIYNLGGQLLHQRANLKGSESFVLNPGVYIVKYGLEAVKVVVK